LYAPIQPICSGDALKSFCRIGCVLARGEKKTSLNRVAIIDKIEKEFLGELRRQKRKSAEG
jgi:hypothetical protein